MIFDIVNGTNAGRAKVISCTDLVNFYPEIEDGAKAKFTKALIGCPGYRLAVTANTEGQCRALYTTSTGRLFIVAGSAMKEITTAEAATSRGTLSTSIGQCVVSDNGTQMMITDGTNGYIYNLSNNTLATISDGDYPASTTHNIFTDGYFLVCRAGASGQFYFSASYDGTSWDALDFATAEYSADVMQGIAKTSNGTIWMIGKQSLELWSNVGVADLPWRRISGSVKEIGCIAPYSIRSNGENVFWLGDGQNGYGAVFMGTGYEVRRISTPAIEYQIKQLTNIDQATAFTYSDESHVFYVLNFGSEKTFVYDLSSGEWHRRGTYNTNTGFNQRSFAQGCAYFNGKLYVGSYLDAGVYEMSLEDYDEESNEILREIQTNHIASENRYLRHKKIEIDLEKGVGLVSGATPTVMLRFSDDGGHTWSNEITSSAGVVGNYTARARFTRLGRSRDRVYRITMSDAVPWVVSSAFVEVE